MTDFGGRTFNVHPKGQIRTHFLRSLEIYLIRLKRINLPKNHVASRWLPHAETQGNRWPKTEGKCFHPAELTFRRGAPLLRLARSNGRVNLRPSMQNPSPGVLRSALAVKLLETPAGSVDPPTGELGISSSTWLPEGNALRTATSMPPALTFSPVAKSSVCLPFWSRLRTKTGMASGSLAHFLRSFSDLAAPIHTSPKPTCALYFSTLAAKFSPITA